MSQAIEAKVTDLLTHFNLDDYINAASDVINQGNQVSDEELVDFVQKNPVMARRTLNFAWESAQEEIEKIKLEQIIGNATEQLNKLNKKREIRINRALKNLADSNPLGLKEQKLLGVEKRKHQLRRR